MKRFQLSLVLMSTFASLCPLRATRPGQDHNVPARTTLPASPLRIQQGKMVQQLIDAQNKMQALQKELEASEKIAEGSRKKKIETEAELGMALEALHTIDAQINDAKDRLHKDAAKAERAEGEALQAAMDIQTKAAAALHASMPDKRTKKEIKEAERLQIQSRVIRKEAMDKLRSAQEAKGKCAQAYADLEDSQLAGDRVRAAAQVEYLNAGLTQCIEVHKAAAEDIKRLKHKGIFLRSFVPC